ncbi:hypothetical protein GCM10028806_34790 [Spirosoma terrae]|uniref:Uncharacterized protein n=1 Tax=Spirosoma terrae TaxID=1968276 RepID=A0A6L9L8V0_9BACT|nr:hypothetical protein [Spirosoma terrae]NDU95792.1 hypothetical protein [Spirosoma terrae]
MLKSSPIYDRLYPQFEAGTGDLEELHESARLVTNKVLDTLGIKPEERQMEVTLPNPGGEKPVDLLITENGMGVCSSTTDPEFYVWSEIDPSLILELIRVLETGYITHNN